MAKQTVLVVDDDIDLVEIIRVTLEKEGYEVLDAQSGERGLALARMAEHGRALPIMTRPSTWWPKKAARPVPIATMPGSIAIAGSWSASGSTSARSCHCRDRAEILPRPR